MVAVVVATDSGATDSIVVEDAAIVVSTLAPGSDLATVVDEVSSASITSDAVIRSDSRTNWASDSAVLVAGGNCASMFIGSADDVAKLVEEDVTATVANRINILLKS